jgi:Secretion system C-terminal sorting domain
MKKIFLALSLFFSLAISAQQVPFTVEIEPVISGPISGMHSFAFAQSGTKWLFVGGRTNGLHGFSTNNSFDVVYASDVITVIDTVGWNVYSSSLGQLPTAMADPLRSTNAQYTRIGDYLYIVGGFGWDSIANGYRTFPVLTAIHVDNMINAVMNGSSITGNIRQITDTNLRVCGGEMQTINGESFLFFGHNFYGRYSDPPIPTFTQIYNNQIKRFTITDDGVNLGLSNYSAITDTNNFHRRDLNVGPVIHPDGSQGVCAYSGVFRKDVNWPYLWPIEFDPQNGAQVDSSFDQLTNNYTCAYTPLFDSVQGTMYTVMFGGISFYDYITTTNQYVFDSLVPFVSDITVLVHDAAGQWTQVPLQLQMPGLQGSNMKFVPLNNVPAYSNEVIRLRELSGRVLAGYLVGGIVSPTPNLPPTSWANDTVYRVWITPDQVLLSASQPNAEGTVDVFPNPANERIIIRVHTNETVLVQFTNAQGEIVKTESVSDRQDIQWNTATMASGIYFLNISWDGQIVQKKLVVLH